MAGGKPTSELPVTIDADGKSVFEVFKKVNDNLTTIQKQVTDIGKTAGISAEKFKTALDVTVKQLRDQMSQMRTLAQGMNAPGVGIQSLNANRGLALQTRAATEYAQTLKMARDSAEALRAKINDLNKEMAGRGAKDQGATIAQRDRLGMYEKQLAALKALDAQAAQNERRISKTKGGDLTAELKALSEAQARLNKAALDPNKNDISKQILAAQVAQDKLTDAINRTRSAQAQLLREEKNQRTFLAQREVRQMVGSNGNATSLQAGLGFQKQLAEDRLAAATGNQIGPAREALQLAQARVREIDKIVAGTKKEIAEVVKRNALIDREDRRRQGALANREVRDLVNQAVPLNTIKSGMGFQRELAENKLAAARSPAEIVAARESLAVAERRVKIIDQIVAKEEQLGKKQIADAAALQRAADARLAAANRESEAKAKMDNASQWRGSREYLIGEAKKVQEITQARQLLASTETNIAGIRQRMLGASTAEEMKLREQLLTEKQIEAQLKRNIAEIERAAAAQARLNAAAAKQNAPKEPTSILPAGGFPTVFARTAAYGAAGTVLFGLVSTLKQGAQFAVDFEDKLKTLQAIANATEGEMVGLRKSIEGVGETSRYSLTDLTDMAAKLAQAGVSAGSMGEALQSVSALATASGSSPAEAVDLITAALGAFQLQASETPRVADLMTSALNRTRLTVQQAALAIQYVGATAYEQNISLETLLSTAAALSQAGIRSGSTIGTGMRQFLVDLQSPSEKLTAAFDKLKITAADVDVSVRGLPAVLQTLNEKGFGAASAYGALETRAAAFYLVARNNTGLMQDLQLQMTEAGATAVAQERAMDSLTAQWQRFKNIVGTGFAESAQGILDTFKGILRTMSDNLMEARRLEDQYRIERDAKLARGAAGVDDIESGYSYGMRKLIGGIETGVEFAGNVISSGPAGADGKQKLDGTFGTWLISIGKSSDAASSALERLTTTMNEQQEAAGKHSDTISGLDKEMARLQLQQQSIDGTMGGVNLETAALTSRFEGLSGQIGGAINSTMDLIGAMERLKNIEAGLLIEQLGGQINTANDVINNQTPVRAKAIQDFRSNPEYMKQLSRFKGGVGALNSLTSEDPTVRLLASRILTDFRTEMTRQNSAQSTAIATAIGKVTNSNSAIGAAEGDRGVALKSRDQVNWMNNTPIGLAVQTTTRNVEALIAEMRSADPEKRKELRAKIDTQLGPAIANLNANIAKFPEAQTARQREARTALLNYRVQADGIMAPTAAQTRASEREAKAAETAAAREARRPRTPAEAMADFEAALKRLGIVRGSGRTGFRTTADQQEIHAAGDSPLDGVRRPSRHQTRQALDPSRATHDDAKARQAAREAGLTGFRVVPESGGRFHYQWTGHDTDRQAGEESELDLDAIERDAERRDAATNRMRGRNAEKDLKAKIKDLKYATSEALFTAGEAEVEASFEAWEKQLRDSTMTEIVNGDFNEQEIADRLAVMEDEILQRREAMETSIFDAVLKNIDAQLKVIDAAFAARTRASEDAVIRAQSAVEGLGFYSNRGKVPDYVEQLAQNRLAQSQEGAARTRQAELPGAIDAKEAVLRGLEEKKILADFMGDDGKSETLAAQIDTLTASIAALKTEKLGLDDAFAAADLIPKTLGEGLNQAILAFQQANNVGQSFTDMMVNNMGGALNTLHQGFETMFTDIMTGSQTVLGAFANFAQGMIKYMIQLAAKAVALKIFNMILGAIGSAVGSKVAPASTGGGVNSSAWANANANFASPGVNGFGGFTGGGNVHGDGLVHLMKGGGRVMNGSPSRDSVNAKIAKNEWVVNSDAVESVGHDFMAKLNSQGSAALDAMRGSPIIVPQGKNETNVYVVKEGQRPQLGKNDILLAVHEDIMSGGETKKLIHHVSQGG